MRNAHRSGLALTLCALAAACGGHPIGAAKNADASVEASGHAGTTGTDARADMASAGTTGAAGTTAGAAGNTAPVCTPGEAVCTGPSQAVVCMPNGVWSTDNKPCSYGCTLTVCRVCAPGDVICSSPTTMQRCQSDGLQWAPPELCANGCDSGTCAPPCQPGVGECVTDTDIRICRGEGVWGATVNCKFGCSNGACRECEPYTTMCLTPKSSRRCGDDGTWGAAVACADACTNGICTDCQPNTAMCVDEKSIHACNDTGTWERPEPCDGGICFANSCRSCKPGTVQCGESDSGPTAQICTQEGEWFDTEFCENTCKTGKCGSNPKKVFVTSTTYMGGALGGVAGADAKCQARATAGGLTGTFRAWLSDATNSPSKRFPRDAGPYVLVTGSVVANNWMTLTSSTLRHAINITELGTAAPTATLPGCTTPIVWTDTGADGSLADFASTCGDWTDSSVFSAWLGTTSSQADWTAWACSDVSGTSAATGCGALAPIYCFEQ